MSLASEDAKFIFVRVPRTGSTTFLHYLTGAFVLIDKGKQHASAVELRELWGAKWDEYFTFGFIRNPWDWLVSVYNSGVSVGAGIKEPWAGAPIEPADTPGAHPGQRCNGTFEEWLYARQTTPADWLSDESGPIVDKIYCFEDWLPRWGVQKSAVEHRPYIEWYNPDTLAYVEELCHREIAIGAYVTPRLRDE
jgi:hypothetical protein